MATKKKMLQAAAGQAGGAALDITEVFSTYLYTGNESTQTITNGIDLDGEGGMVWIKLRNLGERHAVFDNERGLDSALATNEDSQARIRSGWMSSFNADGFTLNTGDTELNNNGDSYASWTFRKAPKFFDVVTYTGDGTTNRAITHSLNSDVGFIAIKRTDTSANWVCRHRSTGGSSVLILNNSNATFSSGTRTLTSDSFTVGNGDVLETNASGGTYVAYLFAHNNGDGEFGPDGDQDIIKCGSFSGETTINLGWEPQWVMVKRTDSSSNGEWLISDNMRGWVTAGGRERFLAANSSDREGQDSGDGIYSNSDSWEPTSTGFKTFGFPFSSSGTYIYIAIRRGPLAQPESGTEVFAIDTSGTASPWFDTTFPVDMAFWRQLTADNTQIASRMTGTARLYTNLTNAEGSTSAAQWDYMDGWYDGGINSSYSWMWKRAPGFCDVVAYTGSSPAYASAINHNLGVIPEMMWVKNRSGTSGGARPWIVYHKGTGTTGYLKLNETSALITSDPESKFGNKNIALAPTADVFYVAGDFEVNYSGDTYIAYLFATVPGVSKVGSYTGNGTDGHVIDCGFTSGARFVLIKRTDFAKSWFVWDTARGIITGNDPYLQLNNTTAENTVRDWIDPNSSGFAVNNVVDINANGGTYIFYAIA